MSAPNANRLVAAAANPLSVAIAIMGGATFRLSGIWWLLPATLVTLGLSTAAHYRAQRAASEDLKSPYAERERTFSSLIDRIERALADASRPFRASLPGIAEQLRLVRGNVGTLLRRQSQLDEFLRDVARQRGPEDLSRLEAALLRARTDDARDNFQSALANKRGELEAREDLHAASERIASELAELQAALENSLSRIVSLEHTHRSGFQAEGAGVTLQLGDVLITIQALEQALSELHDANGQRIGETIGGRSATRR